MSQCIESNERKVVTTISLIISFHSSWKTLNDFKNGMSTNFRMCFDIEVWSIVNLVWWAMKRNLLSCWGPAGVERLLCSVLFSLSSRIPCSEERWGRAGDGDLSTNQSWEQSSIDQSEARIGSAALDWRGSLYFYGIDNRASLPWSPSTTQY